MKNALEIVAFSNVSRLRGIIALIDVAQAALDEDSQPLAAAYLEHAREAYLNGASSPVSIQRSRKNNQ